jgi:hypothetical protein
MKTKLNLLLLGLMMTLTFTACCNDDNDSISASDLTGSWLETRWLGWVKIDGVLDHEWDEEPNSPRLYLNADGTGYYTALRKGEWEVTTEFTWTLEGNVLTMTSDYGADGTVVNRNVIESLDENTMVLVYDYEVEAGINGEIYTGHNVSTYTRLTK